MQTAWMPTVEPNWIVPSEARSHGDTSPLCWMYTLGKSRTWFSHSFMLSDVCGRTMIFSFSSSLGDSS